MHLKIHYQTDQDALLERCGGVMWSLINTERGVKSAASEVFPKSVIESVRPDKHHFLMHAIAMGDQEAYGPNKNGDGWPKEACISRHDTFVKFGHFYREHRNRDPKTQSIGSIKLSAYNPEMRRIELLIWGRLKPDGHYKLAAEEEYELARDGKELSFSMSARVPDDICSCCKHRAKQASDYCDHLRYHMLQYLPQFKKYAFAINDEPTFFDISRVKRPADRIAHYLEYRFADPELRKAASDQRQVITGADWAEYEGLVIPEAYLPEGPAGEMLRKLAALEDYAEGVRKEASSDLRAKFARDIAPYGLQEDCTPAELEAFRDARPGTLFYELAKTASLLPFHTFAAYATNKSVEDVKKDPAVIKAACMILPRIFTRMAANGCSGDLSNLFRAGSRFAVLNDDRRDDLVQNFMDQVSRKFSIAENPVRTRVVITITKGAEVAAKPEIEKSASVDDLALTLAESYGHYQLSALQDMLQLNGSDSVGEPQMLLAVGHNQNVYR